MVSYIGNIIGECWLLAFNIATLFGDIILIRHDEGRIILPVLAIKTLIGLLAIADTLVSSML